MYGEIDPTVKRKIDEILDTAAGAYGPEFPRSFDDALAKGISGDGLANFIRIELEECLLDEGRLTNDPEKILDLAIDLMGTALNDIKNVLYALADMKNIVECSNTEDFGDD